VALLGNLTGSAPFFNPSRFYNDIATQSLRFGRTGPKSLNRTPSSASNRKTWTWSGWIKPSIVGQSAPFFTAYGGTGSQNLAVSFNGNTFRIYNYNGSSNDYILETNAFYRDSSAWYHIAVAIDTTQGTASNRIKVYINGEQITSFSTETYPSQNFDGFVNSSAVHKIGSFSQTTSFSYDGYMAEVNFIDGTALDPTYFGETKNGVWIPTRYTGSYGTNGFRLQFNQTGTGTASTSTIGADTSGNNNHWTSSGIVASDCAMPDSPENNFCTINSIREDTLVNGSVTLSEGNLQSVDGGTTYGRHWSGTFGMSTGKWYWEVLAHTLGGIYANIGLGNDTEKQSVAVSSGSINVYYGADGKRNPRAANSETTNYGATYADDDIIGIAFDADNETVQFYKNNAGQGAVGSILVQATGPYFPSVGDGQNSTTYKYVANFGQDSSFAGNKTAQGNTDANGIGDFYYAPPSGYLALCTANLPEPTISPNAATQADDYFNTVLYSGTGSTQTINTGFSTDFTWIKNRGTTNSHLLADSSRGSTKVLLSNGTNAEITDSDYTTFVSNGFRVSGNGNEINNSSGTYVSWNWKANGGTTSSNSDGSITSTVQANTTAGFSIVTYTVPSGVQTVGHGLTKAPELIINKGRESSSAWWTHTTVIDGTLDYVRLDDTTAKADDTQSLSLPTTTTFGINEAYTLQQNVVSYCFHSVEGYSKIGSYTGNGSTDGTFVYTGFRPAFIIYKKTSGTGNWGMLDNTRSTSNLTQAWVASNLANAETNESTRALDFLSNGFKARGTNADLNTNSATYIYMAFAEAPFKYANAR